MKTFLLMLFICLSLTGCTQRHSVSYPLAMKQKLSRYSTYSKRHLQGAFQKAHVAYPPKRIALLIFKRSKRMELYASQQRSWHYIKSFSIKAASGGLGPKLQEGDHQVPEGIYRISALNPSSHFLMSMKLNYPNAFDREEAQLGNRGHLGGNIFIHGKASSIGCIAIGNDGIEQLFPLVAAIGADNVQVIIAPADLRYKKLSHVKVRPGWLPLLYQKIRVALSRFPQRRQAY